jgi:mevalonate kinase
MRVVEASAPGKIILIGEHAVVYGEPAIAVPVNGVRAIARIIRVADELSITSDQSHKTVFPTNEPENPLSVASALAIDFLRVPTPHVTIEVESSIPVASGLGSGAAVSAAIIQVLAGFYDKEIDREDLSSLVYEVEKIHHGSPSGIDNATICYQTPILFRRGSPPEVIDAPENITFVIGDTGIASLTKLAVADVRRQYESEPDKYGGIFSQIGDLTSVALESIHQGDCDTLGLTMNSCHALLQQLDVSSRELDRLVEASRSAGALGAKMSGGGRGGNMVALVDQANLEAVSNSMKHAGAVRTIVTRMGN